MLLLWKRLALPGGLWLAHGVPYFVANSCSFVQFMSNSSRNLVGALPRLLMVGLASVSCACSRSVPPEKSVEATVATSAAETTVTAESLVELPAVAAPSSIANAFHVHPGQEIQDALEKAAMHVDRKTVIVHAGIYQPSAPRQALIWLNKRHDGIHLKAEGVVTLTAANPEIAKRSAKSYPAIVNHVIYCGDGVGPNTRIEGFRITGANNFTMNKGPVIEPSTDPELKRTAYFYYDGGGIKIYGRSYPTLERLEIFDNYSSPCGAGISIEHRGFKERHVTIRDCVFRNNRVPLTGAALDLLGHDKGSTAIVENCLFVNNASNGSMDSRSLKLGSWMPEAGHGAITVFEPCHLTLRNCTIVGNRNGVDDLSPTSSYEHCIFWKNTAEGGWVRGERYDASISHGAGVVNCFFAGLNRKEIDSTANDLEAPNPEFDAFFTPQNAIFAKAGYRPIRPSTTARPDN